ncbi:hypothetical protein HPB49_005002 [Dermacentor silvarum]|uniref:Uncharacterized protein n=1 Tax=Dermacentor silvarum TaxID=543639 RepID=A0ACB8DB96_DERSI|nr:hypothetical protein HPB49_005002 [Dermacentor silvarum]
MIQLWQRKQCKSPPKTPKLRETPAASQQVAAGMSTHLLPGGAPNLSPLQAPRRPSWRPRYRPRIGCDDLIVVLKPRASFDLKTVLPLKGAGEAVRTFLGDCLAANLHLPFRGHPKASGDICRSFINIDPAASSSSVKPNLEWPKGTILAAPKLGDSNVAVVTFEGSKVPRFTFYRCQVAYAHLYKKTLPVCSCCGTIGHKSTACPSHKPGFCSRCGSQVPTTPECLAQRDCKPRCILCTGPHETGARGCPGHAPLTQPKYGSRFKAPPPATPEHFPPLAAPPKNSELQRQVAALAKQLESLRSQLFPPQPKSALPLAKVAVSPPPNPSSSSPPKPPSQERPLTRQSPPRSRRIPLRPSPQFRSPWMIFLRPILLFPFKTVSRVSNNAVLWSTLRALPDLLIQHMGETIVPKITAEVLKAVQIWACSQFRFKKPRSRSASPNASPRRRKLAGTANTPFNPVLVPPSPAPPVPDPVLVPA